MTEQMKTYSKDALGYYRIIGVSYDADENLAKLKYRERAKRWHPDHNSSDEAKENFQKLSVAYDIISNENKRLTYDILCSAYPAEKMPPLFSLKPYKNGQGRDDFNLKAISLTKVKGKIIGEEISCEDKICNYNEAIKEAFSTSVVNWLCGWWSLKAFKQNIKAIINNFNGVDKNRAQNYQLWAHNALAYWQNKQLGNAYISAVIAGKYADAYQKTLLKKLMTKLGLKPNFEIKSWNFGALRLVQLFIPLLLVLIVVLPTMIKFLPYDSIAKYFQHKDSIEYNQQVVFNDGDVISDDMVVGKIIKIPVDITDISKLYHLKSEQKVMYGPSEDFDVLKRLKEGTTVRLTGISPDKTWSRIMLDEGEMGFIQSKYLAPGIGNDIPYGSQIYQK